MNIVYEKAWVHFWKKFMAYGEYQVLIPSAEPCLLLLEF